MGDCDDPATVAVQDAKKDPKGVAPEFQPADFANIDRIGFRSSCDLLAGVLEFLHEVKSSHPAPTGRPND
jgi:hypothetical protein